MLVKTSELKESALEWAVAQVEYSPEDVKIFSGNKYPHSVRVMSKTFGMHASYYPSTSYCQGAPLIEKHLLDVMVDKVDPEIAWMALASNDISDIEPLTFAGGPTLLIAAMRCLVLCKLGDMVEIPKELLDEYAGTLKG